MFDSLAVFFSPVRTAQTVFAAGWVDRVRSSVSAVCACRNGDFCRSSDHVFEIAEHILFRFNRLAVDLEQIVALANINAWLVQRCSERSRRRRVGHRVIDFFETVFSICDLIVGPEQTNAIAASAGRWRIAAANTEMAD